jgi:hypothetical protein
VRLELLEELDDLLLGVGLIGEARAGHPVRPDEDRANVIVAAAQGARVR